jgi:peptide/nickel transport system substrate-binding protein
VNPDWWGPPVAFEQINLTWVAEAATAILRLQNGDLHLVPNVAPETRDIVDQTPGLRTAIATGTGHLWINIREDKHPALADKRVRRAMNHAFNYDAINRSLLKGVGSRMKSVVNPPNEPANATPYTYDVQKAKALMREAGYPDGFSVGMTSPQGRYLKDAEIAQAIVQDLGQIGIKVDLELLAGSVFAQRFVSPEGPRPLALLIQSQSISSGIDELRLFEFRQGARDLTAWPRPADFTQMMNQLITEFDPKRQSELIEKSNATVWDEAVYLFIHKAPGLFGVSKKLEWAPRADERLWMHEAGWAN